MDQRFDKFGQPEIPYIILCNPDKTELFSLGLSYETKITKKFNAISEFSFSFPKSIDGGLSEIEAYEFIQNKRLVLIEGYGYFQITDANEDLDGSVPVKNVKSEFLEIELVSKRVTAYGGTNKLWDILDSQGTILQDMINLAPNWSVGHVDTELLTVYRTFNVSDTNIYNFLTNDVSKAFECIFLFDSINREINVYTQENATTQTDIFLSFDNVISKAEFSEKSDEITTCMSVYGGGTLNIRNVNPLGTDKIYNFSYYKNTNWMSQGLVNALTAWENTILSNQDLYADTLSLLFQYNQELLVLQSDLADLNSDKLTLEGVQAVRIQAGEDYSDINAQIASVQSQIDNQNILIQNKQGQINTSNADLLSINQTVSFENNFTPTQLLELNNFIYENTYKNENIIQTDSMTIPETQEAAQTLYNQAQNVLARVSQPRYEFSLDAINYTGLEEFQVFTEQTELGSEITVELKNGQYITAVLLELEFQFDDPSNFSMTFSNRLRLDNGSFMYSDLIGQVVKTGSAVSFDSLKWSDWENNYKDSVSTFITSSLNASVNNLISSENQDILINQNGLRARQWNGASYEDKQMWMVNNMLAFSDDGFQTAKLALGEISLDGGGTAYGLIADVIVGRLLAGNSLTIANENNNFVLDSSGATLTNAKFSIQTINTKVNIDPTALNVFSIQKNEGGTFNNKFWVDNAGNVNFSGNLTGATGTFSGTLSASIGNIGSLVIDSNGLKTADGNNYLRGNGDFKWGALSITGSTSVFTGDIYANKIVGQIVNTQVSDGAISDNKISVGVNAGKVTLGTMSGNRVYGGSPYVDSLSSATQVNVGGASMYTVGSNFEIVIGGTVSIASGSGGYVSAGSSVSIGGGSVFLNVSNLYIGGNLGFSGSRNINTPIGVRTITFVDGICTGIV